jgi:hypothetical protein
MSGNQSLFEYFNVSQRPFEVFVTLLRVMADRYDLFRRRTTHPSTQETTVERRVKGYPDMVTNGVVLLGEFHGKRGAGEGRTLRRAGIH